MSSPISEPTSTDDGYYTFHDHDDAAHLHALGYQSEFKRDMSPWANFSLGFTYLSPVVASTRCSPTPWPPAAHR